MFTFNPNPYNAFSNVTDTNFKCLLCKILSNSSTRTYVYDDSPICLFVLYSAGRLPYSRENKWYFLGLDYFTEHFCCKSKNFIFLIVVQYSIQRIEYTLQYAAPFPNKREPFQVHLIVSFDTRFSTLTYTYNAMMSLNSRMLNL